MGGVPEVAAGTRPRLCEDILQNVSVDVGKAEITALVAVGQSPVVDPEEVEDGGVAVVNMRSEEHTSELQSQD